MAGKIDTDHNWKTVNLSESLKRPVYISKVMTHNGGHNCEERMHYLSHDSFQVRIEETPEYDFNHATETFGYMALEEGIITDGGEEIGEAGTIYAGDQWTRVTFQQRMDAFPVVIASSMSINDSTQGIIRIRNIGINGFDVRFEEYSGVTGHHELEKIGWVAMKPGTHTLDGEIVMVGIVDDVTHSPFKWVNFNQSFGTTPMILTQIQSYNEEDLGSHTRQKNPTSSSFELKIEEENDTDHIGETVGYIAMEPATLKSGAAKIGETKYYPYGVVQEGGDEKYLYTGKELDKGTGLYYYEMRYYNPKTGRFIQADLLIPDPFNPQSLNRYAYVLNNPLRYVDPTGEFNVEGFVGGVAMAGLGIVTIAALSAAAPAIATGALIIGGTGLILAGAAYSVGMGGSVVIISSVVPEEGGQAVDNAVTLTANPVISPTAATITAASTGGDVDATIKTTQNVNDLGVLFSKGPAAMRVPLSRMEFIANHFDVGRAGINLIQNNVLNNGQNVQDTATSQISTSQIISTTNCVLCNKKNYQEESEKDDSEGRLNLISYDPYTNSWNYNYGSGLTTPSGGGRGGSSGAVPATPENLRAAGVPGY